MKRAATSGGFTQDAEDPGIGGFNQGDKAFEMQHAAGPEQSSSSQYATTSSTSSNLENTADGDDLTTLFSMASYP
jgi:hypothetical protein